MHMNFIHHKVRTDENLRINVLREIARLYCELDLKQLPNILSVSHFFSIVFFVSSLDFL